MREVFAETDTQLPTVGRARLGTRRAVFASPKVIGPYELLFAEAWPGELYPVRFRLDEARLPLLGRTVRSLGDLEAAVRGADPIPPKTGPAPLDAQRSATGGDLLAGSRALRIGLRTWAISLGI